MRIIGSTSCNLLVSVERTLMQSPPAPHGGVMVPPAVPNGGCSIVLLRWVGQGRAVLPLVALLCIGDHCPILV
jgi:hypothetical protein